ncbi:hypothetical protein [Intrasporangium sp. YIM S08009]|nr:hypothetical protein [Intrasporangium sp. YIM S08009]
MKLIIRVLAVTAVASGLLLSGTGAQARSIPPSWCVLGPQSVDGTCTY